ncbi:Hypothetical_protein [Hexamita inflata]|uniref:Hypothetical_protein n=1 Tax=Hexamita inflata TaxID=28002 RepID=A0AA86QUS8_9EUKA|nr:Hypothetical protein HINF_LOCUS51207 [Hexamita inflata]
MLQKEINIFLLLLELWVFFSDNQNSYIPVYRLFWYIEQKQLLNNQSQVFIPSQNIPEHFQMIVTRLSYIKKFEQQRSVRLELEQFMMLNINRLNFDRQQIQIVE